MQTKLSPTDGQQATQRYELLRALAIGEPGAATLQRELTLVLRQGLPAWLSAWRHYATDTDTAAPGPVTPSAAIAPTLSLQAELATVLAAMALAHLPAASLA
jgi:hypothetical protein